MIDLYTWPNPNGDKLHIHAGGISHPYTVHPWISVRANIQTRFPDDQPEQ